MILARTLLPIVGYAGLVVWLTWPLAQRAATHLPNTNVACLTDSLLVCWTLAHQSRALVTSPTGFPDGGVFHPAPQSLFYGETAFGALPYFLGPFLATGNPVLAFNLTFLVSIALTAWALHFVVARWSGSPLGGVLAACVFLTTPWVLWRWVPAAANYAVLQYMPFIMYLVAAPELTRRRGLVLAALVALQGLSSPYIAVVVVLVVATSAALRLARPATRTGGVRLLAAVATASLGIGLAYAGQLFVRSREPAFDQQSVYAVLPIVGRTSLPWGPFGPNVPSGVSGVAWVVIALGVSSLMLGRREGVAKTPRRAWTQASLWVAVGLAVSVTPVVSWQGAR